MDMYPFLKVSVKVNLNSEIGRFGLMVRVGGGRQSCCAVVNVEHTVYTFCLSDGHHKWTIAKR